MSFAILGTGTAVPPTAYSQTIAQQVFQVLGNLTPEQSRLLPRIFGNTGIQKRHFVWSRDVVRDILEGTRHTQSEFLPRSLGDSGKTVRDPADVHGPTTRPRMQEYVRQAGPLAQEAAQLALQRAEVLPRQITHLVTVSCTGVHSPGVDVELIHGLKLPITTERTHIGSMGCHGALNGLRVVRGLLADNPRARALLCCVELSSVHCVYSWDVEQLVACSLFGDGAAALVGAATGPANSWQVAGSGSCVFPGSMDAMSWALGDHGFEMKLSKAVPELIASNLSGWLSEWLCREGLTVPQVPTWCIHPGGPKILQAVAQGLGLDEQALAPARAILSEFGNMSSATILFILERLIAQNAPRPCVALGFGPGLTAEAAILR